MDDLTRSREGIRVEQLQVRRGRRIVLESVSFAHEHGVLALLGPNGAGKSSLLAVLATLRRPAGGEIAIAGHRIATGKDRRAVRGAIGFQAQDDRPPAELRCADYVRYAAWLAGVDRSALDHATARALSRVNLTEHGRTRIRHLSGGMLRRLTIAAAIAHRPRVLLLDEPTAGLDPHERLSLTGVIRALAGSATIVMSTHLSDDVRRAADSVAVFSAGRMTFSGSLDSFERLAPGDLDEAYRAAVDR
ncbi:ABC transporter ATP-binding protein [Homoserinibacter sp. GY 40078]|uniref:ABC transporter ATP-binding protein n=1 Tax=Homoserinibacter sp. GY 40078 TaxID=2603275 RepID=UPI0011C73232|nr:ATP-binding cassette domain-containing protein [Homoserinibacter sp. GY 40078]TXK19795.1 ATP-binding cassette domain-containing protein [Homoserinibacter sp. GY 40078]